MGSTYRLTMIGGRFLPSALFHLLALTCVLVRTFPLNQRLLAEAEVNLLVDEPDEEQLAERSLQAIQRTWQRRHRRRLNQVTEALAYLRKFGYLEEGSALTEPKVEAAIAAFQEVAGIGDNGRLSKATIRAMRSPRCGNSDLRSNTDVAKRRRKRFGDHGDEFKFDGPGNQSNILAHTFYPNYQETGSLNGDIHFDDYEKWILDDSAGDGTHFPYVLVHEIGHSLGLGHSKWQRAIMNPIYKREPISKVRLDWDDKCAINWNYIGPSNMCLFVWLLREVIPRANEQANAYHDDNNMVSTGSESASAALRQIIFSDTSFEQKLNATLNTLKDAELPLCSKTNNVQGRYEVLLEQKLDFPRETAKEYSQVACNFLDGLNEQVEDGRDGPASVVKKDATASDVTLLTVHKYEHPEEDDFYQLANRSRRALEIDSVRIRSKREHRHRHHSRRQRQVSVFDRAYFDSRFFRHFFHVLLEN